MHVWTNEFDGYKERKIATGPTPDGKVKNLVVTIEYESDGGNLYKAIALDGHIIPLILRAPEMRDTLRECADQLRDLCRHIDDEGGSTAEIGKLLARIEALTAPTREEAEQGA